MLINESETLLDFTAAANHPSLRIAGRSPNRQAICRWGKRGLRTASGGRALLEILRTPLGPMTSVEAIERFKIALNSTSETPPAAINSARNAMNRLAAKGIC